MAELLAVKEFDEIVFENRNKEYGAYVLRKKYNRNMNIAFAISIATLLLAISIPTILDKLNELTAEEVKVQEVDLTLADPPPLDKDEPPPPPPPPDPPPPVQETIKFTPPVIVEEVKEEDIPPPVEQTNETTVSTKTQEGSNEIIDLPDDGGGGDDLGLGQQEIFTIVEQMPEFQGGEEKLREFLSKNIKYPAMARENGISGTVYITFVVEGDGRITDVKSLRGLGGGLTEEALRVVKMMPNWTSGKQNGKPVRVQFTLPVKFTLR
jgi:periplasmic protein TonB